jgi:hypothetical protein
MEIMGDYVHSSYVKVKIKGKKSIYLEQVKYLDKGGHKFVSGYEIDKYAESKILKGDTVVMHLIELGAGVTVVPQMQHKMYLELADLDEGKI